MADVNTGADADISPGLFWGEICFLGSNGVSMTVLPEIHQCTTLRCDFSCFGSESERNRLTRAGQKC